MAELVLGFASSHGPQLSVPGENWSVFGEKDQNDRRMDYQALLARNLPGLDEQITIERMQARYEHCQTSMDALRRKVASVAPDVMIVIGDDQHEQFLDGNMPMFSIYYGESVLTLSRRRAARPSPIASGAGGGPMAWQQAQESPTPEREFPGHAKLARHLIKSMIDQDIDIGTSNELNPDIGVGHAFTFLYRYITPEGNIPIVPFSVNTFFKPNQPMPGRCFDVGRALRRAIDAWDSPARVAVMASGGLSHVILDEEIDHMTLDALRTHDEVALRALPVDRLDLGTSEIRNWVMLAGVVEDKAMDLIAYEPCYRSLAGTGCAMGFATWE